MKKKLLLVFLSLCILLSAVPVGFAAQLDAAVQGGQGNAETAAATRGEVAELLLIAADDYNSGVTKSDIIKGYGDGLLHENQTVTRAEALVMLQRAFGALPVPKGQNAKLAFPADTFTDVPDWAKTELAPVFKAGIVAGTAPGTFSPDEAVTMKQMRLFIHRVFALFGANEKDDFYSTVAREYLDSYEMKPGRSMGGVAYDVRDDVIGQIDEIIKELIAKPHAAGTPEQKMADYYETIMDTEGRNQAGYAPIQPFLDAIDKARNVNDLLRAQSAVMEQTGCYQFMSFSLAPDYNDSSKYSLYFTTAQPEMEQSFYMGTDEHRKQLYLDYVTKRLSLIDAQDAASAEEVYEFDKRLAEKMLSPEDHYDIDKINNRYSFDQLEAMFPGVDIEEALRCSGLKKEGRILIDDSALTQEYANLFTNDHLKVLKTRAKLEIIKKMGGLISKNFTDVKERFENNYWELEGGLTDEELAVQALQNKMSTYLGKAYAEKYFSAEQKEDVTNMAKDIIEVYKKRVSALSWMSDATKREALKKLETMVIKVGYPDRWDTYVDNVQIKSTKDGGSYFSNWAAINRALQEYTASLQGKPVDKTEWIAKVYEVNAFYNPQSNEIIFPAAYLQPPIYDPQKSYEYNLGSIGYTIGHEITHAFDSNGAKFDENGNVSNWWAAEDYAAFQKLCDKMAALYDGYEFAPGIAIDGARTLSENVADQGSVACMMEILSGLKNPNYKEFFNSLSLSDILITSREFAQYLTQNDVHALGKSRTNPILSNCKEFYETFGIDERDGMYLAPEDRVAIW